jgi:hypothetical protein
MMGLLRLQGSLGGSYESISGFPEILVDHLFPQMKSLFGGQEAIIEPQTGRDPIQPAIEGENPGSPPGVAAESLHPAVGLSPQVPCEAVINGEHQGSVEGGPDDIPGEILQEHH